MKQETTFELEGRKYHAFPNLETYVVEAGVENAHLRSKILKVFEEQGIVDVSQLYSQSISGFQQLGFPKSASIQLVRHLQRLRRKTTLITTLQEQKERQQSYLPSHIPELDHIFDHVNGKVGLPSGMVTEFYGEASIGKTQLLHHLSLQMILQGRPVVYIDTEGALDPYRVEQLANHQGIDPTDQFRVARAYNFDDLDMILNQLAIELRTHDLGMIVIDSIIEPLRIQYPLDDDLTQLQPRQQHLHQVLSKLKSMAQIHDLVVVISNQVRASFDGENGIVPQGGNVLAHATDLRLWIRSSTQTDQDWYLYQSDLKTHGIQFVDVELIDCGFLPPSSGTIMLTPIGIVSPETWVVVVGEKKADQIIKKYQEEPVDLEDIEQSLYQ